MDELDWMNQIRKLKEQQRINSLSFGDFCKTFF